MWSWPPGKTIYAPAPTPGPAASVQCFSSVWAYKLAVRRLHHLRSSRWWSSVVGGSLRFTPGASWDSRPTHRTPEDTHTLSAPVEVRTLGVGEEKPSRTPTGSSQPLLNSQAAWQGWGAKRRTQAAVDCCPASRARMATPTGLFVHGDLASVDGQPRVPLPDFLSCSECS
ncbi:hypothetical protein NDU88_005360 [Pleurodeles waltl]|uniref:Uncharacterized protein n=1 Tax=Pleurodeles waltl TaxID=8319 RepID=A0AAV7VLA0_PLEWA|nr:hypothetical protein NDU88_005360 [Pleurodeles waltl]